MAACDMKALCNIRLILNHCEEILAIRRRDRNTDQRIDLIFRLDVSQYDRIPRNDAALFHPTHTLADCGACQRHLLRDLLDCHTPIYTQKAQYFLIEFIHFPLSLRTQILNVIKPFFEKKLQIKNI